MPAQQVVSLTLYEVVGVGELKKFELCGSTEV
jgi:hypothetical protein